CEECPDAFGLAVVHHAGICLERCKKTTIGGAVAAVMKLLLDDGAAVARMSAQGACKLAREIGIGGIGADHGTAGGQELAQECVQAVTGGVAGKPGEELGITAVVMVENLGQD